MRSTGVLGTDAQLVCQVAPWSLLTLLLRLVRPWRSEKYRLSPLSTASSVSPPPAQVVGLPPMLPGANWYVLPWSSDDHRKLSVVEKPLGTLEKMRSWLSTTLSGSKPTRCCSIGT